MELLWVGWMGCFQHLRKTSLEVHKAITLVLLSVLISEQVPKSKSTLLNKPSLTFYCLGEWEIMETDTQREPPAGAGPKATLNFQVADFQIIISNSCSQPYAFTYSEVFLVVYSDLEVGSAGQLWAEDSNKLLL